MTVDEEAFKPVIFDYIRKVKPDIGEERQQRIAQLSADVINIMDVSAFEKGKHWWYDSQWIFDRLIEYERIKPDEVISDIDKFWIIRTPVFLNRLVTGSYPNGRGGEIEKFVYNDNYVMKSTQQPKPKEKTKYKNPFKKE